jgi:hypothetical protein
MKGVFIIPRWRGKNFDKKETLSGGVDKKLNRITGSKSE